MTADETPDFDATDTLADPPLADQSETGADVVEAAAEFARRIMMKVYNYRFCESFSTFWDGESEPDDFCLTHDQSRRFCREYQAEALGLLTPLIEARDATLADPAERDEPYDQLDNQRNLWAKQCHEAEARAERAEAEVARLEGQFSDMRGRYAEVAAEVAELRATVDRATKVLRNATYDMPTASLINLLRAALRDPNGGAS